jgi:hypothetical protein
LERGYYGAWLAICVDSVGSFCVGNRFFLVVEGGVLGARTTGVAALLGVVGMFMILVTYMRVLMLGKAEKS